MTPDSLETWFWTRCSEIESKKRDDRTDVEQGMLEFSDLRSRAGGASSQLYFIDSYDIRPSYLANLLTLFGPEPIAAVARDLSRLFPDEMPKGQAEREAYLTKRFEDLDSMKLVCESDAEDPYAMLDEFCMGAGAFELYRRLHAEFR